MTDKVQDLQKSIDKSQAKTCLRKKKELTNKHEDGDLLKCPDNNCGAPNEILRCALFSAKNRQEKRRFHAPDAPLTIPIVGGRKIVFMGQDLRQDDETAWMQLIQYAKEAKSPYAVFTTTSEIRPL